MTATIHQTTPASASSSRRQALREILSDPAKTVALAKRLFPNSQSDFDEDLANHLPLVKALKFFHRSPCCWKCTGSLDNFLEPICGKCRWIKCGCGGCGCNYPLR